MTKLQKIASGARGNNSTFAGTLTAAEPASDEEYARSK